MLASITPLIRTYNEESNIGRVLDRLTWAKRIVIIDSFSTDRTREIATSYPQVDFYQRAFDTFAAQCNYGLQHVASEWVLSLDADYLCERALIDEIAALPADTGKNSYAVRFKYCVFGQPLRGTLYPPRTVLYRRNHARYEQDGHTQRVQIDGSTEMLSSHIRHDDWKPLSSWLKAQGRYAREEAMKLCNTPRGALSFTDRLRKKMIYVPLLTPWYCLFRKGLILDGWRGWYYTFQRTYAELLLSLQLLDAYLRRRSAEKSSAVESADERVPFAQPEL